MPAPTIEPMTSAISAPRESFWSAGEVGADVMTERRAAGGRPEAED